MSDDFVKEQILIGRKNILMGYVGGFGVSSLITGDPVLVMLGFIFLGMRLLIK